MRLLILLLAIVIGSARGRECKWNTQADYSVANNVLTFNSNCTSIGKVSDECDGFPSNVTEVVLPQGLTYVSTRAFRRCDKLTSVTFPETLDSVGTSAFAYCTGLTSVTFPGLQQVGASAFFACSSLTNVTLPEGLKQVGATAFRGCSSLTSVTFPETLNSVGEYAFAYCDKLTSVTFPKVREISRYAFYKSGVISVFARAGFVAEGDSYIGEYAFAYCPVHDVTLRGPFGESEGFIIYNHAFEPSELRRLHIQGPVQLQGPRSLSHTYGHRGRISLLNGPCYEGNYHSDACKNKIAEEYSQTQFIDLYNRNYTSTCN